MSSHAQKQREFVCVVSLGLVGVILAFAHAFAAFSPVFQDEHFETENRSFVAGPVTILELAWSILTLQIASCVTSRTGPGVLAGLVALVTALGVLLVGGGARNWMAGTLLVFVAFWGGVLLELRLGLVHRLAARATASSSPGAVAAAGPPRWTLPEPPWSHRIVARRALAFTRAVEAEVAAAHLQGPPPYAPAPPSMPGEEAATPLLPLRGTHGLTPKTVENE